MKSFVAAQNIVNFKRRQLQIETHLDNEVQPTSGPKNACHEDDAKNLFRRGWILEIVSWNKNCSPVDEIFCSCLVPATNCAADIKFRRSDDFAVAAEYALGQPIRKVNILPAD